jgi:KipI family sensor histidine kinase inhibitor
VLPVGDSAASLEWSEDAEPAVGARLRGVDRALAESPFSGFREAVPALRALLVVYDAARIDFAGVRTALLSLAAAAPPAEAARPLHAVPTLYDGDDIGEVAKARGLSVDAVVALHGAQEYSALMLGFMPGFAYLGPLPTALETPRRATPRVRVPAGSVAVAGRMTGIYPFASPGGWNLIGRTSQRLFDPFADPPALILPGDRVRFVAVRELPDPPASAPHPTRNGAPTVEVIAPGLLTTVQDTGRFGYRRLGVTWAGPMDATAHREANQAVGNATDAATLECTISGPTLRFLTTTRFAVVGADLGALLERSDLGAWPVPLGVSVLARAGNVLTFAGRRSGCRCCLAFAGGLDVPVVLGSRSTDLPAGFGGFEGRALRAGDVLSLGPPPREASETGARHEPSPSTTPTLRVILGPQADCLTPESLPRFLGESYDVAATSDRVGCRLSGPRLVHRGAAEIASEGMLPGSVQIPPDGQPIVMMADAPTTGGYPKVATVIAADLERLAQIVPGAGRVRFEAIPSAWRIIGA